MCFFKKLKQLFSCDESPQDMSAILERLDRMTVEFDRLVTEVAETGASADVAIAALAELKASITVLNTQVADLIAQLADAAGDAAEVTRLADELDAIQVEIAAAVSTEEPTPVE